MRADLLIELVLRPISDYTDPRDRLDTSPDGDWWRDYAELRSALADIISSQFRPPWRRRGRFARMTETEPPLVAVDAAVRRFMQDGARLTRGQFDSIVEDRPRPAVAKGALEDLVAVELDRLRAHQPARQG